MISVSVLDSTYGFDISNSLVLLYNELKWKHCFCHGVSTRRLASAIAAYTLRLDSATALARAWAAPAAWPAHEARQRYSGKLPV